MVIEIGGRAEAAIEHFTNTLRDWVSDQFPEGLGGLRKANLFKLSAVGSLLLAELVSGIQKEIPEDSNLYNLLNYHKRPDGGQVNMVVRLQRPWEASFVDALGRETERSTNDLHEITFLIGPRLSPNDPSERGVIALDLSLQKGGPVVPFIEVRRNVDDGAEEIARPASREELGIVSRLVHKITEDGLVEEIV